MKNNKKKILLLIISIILVVLILLGSSYAYFIASDEGEKQSFTTGNLVVDYEKKTSVISIDNMYPMTDVQGLETTPHEFKVTNNGNIKAKYQVRLELDKNLKNSVPLEYIKISYSKNNGSYTTPVLLSSLSSNLVFIKDQVIDVKTNEEDCDTYKIKMWLDISAPNDVMKKEFKARIVVDSIQYLADNSYSVDTIPVIYLNKNTDGNIDIRLKKGEIYTELGVEKVVDDKDTISNNITPVYEYYNEEEHELEIVSSINTNQVGLYYATYQVEDSNNNVGKAVRVINVIDNTPPRIEFKTGIESTLEIEENDNYIEDIANTVTVDNNNQVVVLGEVKTDVPGKDYIIRYIVIDSNNNINSITRTITVKEKPTAPTITGGTGDSWVSEAQTISIETEGTAYSGVDYYEYYTTQDETDIPDLETGRTGRLEKGSTDLLIEDEGTTYIYYRTVSGLGSKSVWSSPQVINLETNVPTAPTISGGKNNWSVGPINLSISNNSNAASGISKYQYYISTSNSTQTGGSWQDCTTSATSQNITTEGIRYIYFRAVSNAGKLGIISNPITTMIDTQNIHDLSGNNNNASLHGATLTSEGLQFDGIDDYAVINMFNWNSSTQFTIEFDAKIDDSAKPYILMESSSDYNSNINTFVLSANADSGAKTLNIAFKTSIGYNFKYANNIVDNQFHSYTFTFNGNNSYDNYTNIYWDGVKLTSLTLHTHNTNLSPSSYVTGNYPLFISGRNGQAHFAKMIVKKIKIYKKELTQSEVVSSYNGNNVQSSNLLLYYDFIN